MRFVEDVLDRYEGKFEQFLAAGPLSDDEDSSDEEVKHASKRRV